jgi:hypothetical protein
MVSLLYLMQMIEFHLEHALEHRAGVRLGSPVARHFVELKRIQLELDGVTDRAEAQGVAQIALFHHFQVPAAKVASPIRKRQPLRELMAARALPRVAHLRAADLVFFQNRAALRASRWH